MAQPPALERRALPTRGHLKNQPREGVMCGESPLAWLVFGALVQSAAFGGLFLLPFHHLWGTLPTPRPPGGDAPLPPNGWQEPLVVAIVFGVPSLLPLLLLVRAPRELRLPLWPGGLVLTIGCLVLPALVSLVTYPCCTSDVLDYVNRQRLWAVYGGNPFLVVPNDHPEDWSYAFAQFRDSVFGYGPLWWLLARAASAFARTLDEYLLGFKALAAVCFATSLFMVWRLSPPERRLRNALFFAWNPIVLIDGVLRLHNDVLTVPFVLLGLWLWQRRTPATLAVATLGALVKLIVAPLLLLFFALCVAARRWPALLLGGAASLLLTSALYAPFWFGPGTLKPMLVQANRAQWSIGSVLLWAAQPVLGEAAVALVRLALLLSCLALFGVVVRQAVRGSEQTDVLAGRGALLLLVGLLTMPLAFYSHYLTPVIALAALAADARVRVLVLALTGGAMVNALLGIEQLAGRQQGALVDVAGCVVLLVALGVGVLRGGWLGGMSVRRRSGPRVG